KPELSHGAGRLCFGTPTMASGKNARAASQNRWNHGFLFSSAQSFNWCARGRNRNVASRFSNSGLGVGTPPITSSPPIPDKAALWPFDLRHSKYFLEASLVPVPEPGVAAKR